MKPIQSLDELTLAREKALEEKQQLEQSHRYHIRIGMSSCGIATGAQEIWELVEGFLRAQRIKDILVTPIGCMGLCALEPIVQVSAGGQAPITYGKVNPEVIRRILTDHIQQDLVVQEHIIEYI